MKGKIRKLILKSLVILMIGTAIQPALPAQAKVCLSRTKRTYDDYGSHFWDKIKLKNVPSNASIKWKSSAPSVIKIADKFKCGTWYRILKPGRATVTALYKGRKYTCRITVKKKSASPSSTPKPTSKPVKDDDEDEDPQDPSLPKDAHLNATHVTIYYCEPYAIPYAHDESHPTEFQFKLEGSDKRPVWDVTLDDPKVFGWLNISKDGLLTIPTGGCPDATATVTARYFNDVLTCKVTVINETRVKYDELVNEFIRTHIRDGMSDYEKMETVVKYIEEELDYTLYQPEWRKMLITGGGDCMASRLGVYYLCTELGLKSFPCTDLDDHGETLVRVGDDVFMTVTGFNEPKPRLYWIYKLSEESLKNIKTKYPGCMKALGF